MTAGSVRRRGHPGITVKEDAVSNKGVDQMDWHYIADDAVHTLPNGERIRMAREALEDMAEQINGNRFFPLTVEHLAFDSP